MENRSRQAQLLKALKPFVVIQQWGDLEEYLDILIDQTSLALSNATTWDDARELQGRIKAYKTVRNLKNTVLSFEREIKS